MLAANPQWMAFWYPTSLTAKLYTANGTNNSNDPMSTYLALSDSLDPTRSIRVGVSSGGGISFKFTISPD